MVPIRYDLAHLNYYQGHWKWLVNEVAKRFSISLPDGMAKYLEEWAASEGNKPTTLAAFLVERAVRERIERLEANQAGKQS